MLEKFLSAKDASRGRAARLALDLTQRVRTPPKYATDFLRLARLADEKAVETAWRDQRRPDDPATFCEANALLQEIISNSEDLLITPRYSTNANAVCGRCV